jgi:ABC-type transport system involved in multi-copper enzyme maturation permease subunit
MFAAIAGNEVLLNSKRIAPYFMALLCAGVGLLWWGWGPLVNRGVAVNSDFAIAGVLPPYSFLFLPLFTALFMADPVGRDFRLGVDPLIFSKPISRGGYLVGKFFGNFFVLACCQSAMIVMWFALQGASKHGVTTQEVKVFPYIKHFLVLVVISHLGLAAFYFAVGVLTRNARIVYGLGVAFYPLYITYQTVLLSSLPWRWKLALDPLVMNRANVHVPKSSAAFVNQLVVTYEPDLIINRAVMMLLTTVFLTIVYLRFSTSERSQSVEKFSVLNLSTAAEQVYYPESSPATLLDEFKASDFKAGAGRVAIPEVSRVNEGIRGNVNKLIAALGVEFSLIRAERSLVVVMPVAIFCSLLEVAFYNIPPDVTHSVASATNTAKFLVLFLVGIAVFYTGEAMHRDRELKIEPVIWSTPVPSSVVLLSRFLATLVLTFLLMTVVVVTAIAIQFVRGLTPVDISAYLMVYGVVLVPGIIFVTALVVLLHVLLRNKYLVYVVAIGTGAGLFYLYSVGYTHWPYNPMLYQLWQYTDLASSRILASRLYCLIAAVACLSLARLSFARRSS